MLKYFLDLESPEYQAAYNFYLSLLSDKSLTLPDCSSYKQLFQSWLSQHYDFPDNTTETIADYLIASFEKNFAPIPSGDVQPFLNDNLTSDDHDNTLILSQYDIDFLKNTIAENAHVYPATLFYLLMSYSTFARLNPHPNNWIKCDLKDKTIITYLAACTTLSPKTLESLINTLHSVYGLNMRVVGSNQPIPCFQFTWQVEQPSIEDSLINPLISIGPANNLTIKHFVDDIINQAH